MEERDHGRFQLKLQRMHLSDVEQFVPRTDNLALAMHLTGRCKLDWDCERESFSTHPLGHALTLIPAGRSGTFRIVGNSEVVKVIIPRTCFAQLFPKHKPDLADIETRPAFADDLLAELAIALLKCSEIDGRSDAIYRDSLEQTLVSHIFYRYGHTNKALMYKRPTSKLAPSQSRSLISYMQDNLQADISLNDLAKHAGVSVSHFSTQFRNKFGLTPSRYLLSMRLEFSREQLERSSTPIAEIAYRCGFPSASHFAETFRKTYGTTPSSYRDLRRS